MKTVSTKRKGVASQGMRGGVQDDSLREWTPTSLTLDLPTGKGLAEYALRVRYFTPSLVESYHTFPRDPRDRGTTPKIGGIR